MVVAGVFAADAGVDVVGGVGVGVGVGVGGGVGGGGGGGVGVGVVVGGGGCYWLSLLVFCCYDDSCR